MDQSVCCICQIECATYWSKFLEPGSVFVQNKNCGWFRRVAVPSPEQLHNNAIVKTLLAENAKGGEARVPLFRLRVEPEWLRIAVLKISIRDEQPVVDEKEVGFQKGFKYFNFFFGTVVSRLTRRMIGVHHYHCRVIPLRRK